MPQETNDSNSPTVNSNQGNPNPAAAATVPPVQPPTPPLPPPNPEPSAPSSDLPRPTSTPPDPFPSPERRTPDSENVLGQGLKEIPPPQDPFDQLRTSPFDEVKSGKFPPEAPARPSGGDPPREEKVESSGAEKPANQSTDQPPPENRELKTDNSLPPRPPELERALAVAAEMEKGRRNRRNLILFLFVFTLLAAAGFGLYTFVKSLNQQPPVPAESNLTEDSLKDVLESTGEKPNTASPGNPKTKKEAAFGQLPPLDLSFFELKGLSLAAAVIANEASLSASLSTKGARAPVYLRPEATPSATPSAIVRESEKAFTDLIFSKEKSDYKLKNPEGVIRDLVASTKFYAVETAKTDWSKNSFKSLTATLVDLVYLTHGQYLEPIFLVTFKGKLLNGSEREIYLLTPALE